MNGNGLWRRGEQGLKIFVAWSAAEAPPFPKKGRDEGGGTKIFYSEAAAGAAERPCEPLDTARYLE